MANENKLQDIIRTSLENIKEIVDTNTVVGNPISLPNGTTVLPISKVSVGFASGGIDYNGKAERRPDALQNFGGGGGTGISVHPVGFLVIDSNGHTEILQVENSPRDPVEQVANLIDRTPEIIAKIKALFPKKKAEEKED